MLNKVKVEVEADTCTPVGVKAVFHWNNYMLMLVMSTRRPTCC